MAVFFPGPRARVLLLAAAVLLLARGGDAQLSAGFYSATCPSVHSVVRQVVSQAVMNDTRAGAAVLRLFYHDCFVNGCDASLLLDDTPTTPGEKGAGPNAGSSTFGFDLVDAIKTQVETACPGVVSCADTLALAARDSIRLTKGPFIPLPTGREDGNRSVAADVALNTPPPGANITDLIAQFAKFNLTAKDLAVLSGAHTIGKARCSTVSPRLYDFGGQNGSSDPTLDANYTATLRGQCKPGDAAALVDLDPDTPAVFDADYYKLVAGKRGLLSTDAALLLDPATGAYVARQANATAPDEFFADFAAAFVNMSKIGALTHHKGEIRKVCSKVNPPAPASSNSAAGRT